MSPPPVRLFSTNASCKIASIPPAEPDPPARPVSANAWCEQVHPGTAPFQVLTQSGRSPEPLGGPRERSLVALAPVETHVTDRPDESLGLGGVDIAVEGLDTFLSGPERGESLVEQGVAAVLHRPEIGAIGVNSGGHPETALGAQRLRHRLGGGSLTAVGAAEQRQKVYLLAIGE